MLKIAEYKEFSDESLRDMAFEVVVSFIERKKKHFDDTKLRSFIELLFRYGLEMEDEITEEWAIPSGESYLDEDVILEEKVSSAISFLERLMEVFSSNKILGIISEIVINLLNNTTDFRYKYLALTSISNMLDYVDDLKEVESIIDVSYFFMYKENFRTYNPWQC